MKRLMLILPLVLAAACLATEGEERLPSPSATSTQIMGEVTAVEVMQDAEGHYVIADQGDGCEYHQVVTPDSTPTLVNGVEHVSLFDPDDLERCPNGWDYVPSTGELFHLVPAAPQPAK